MMIRNKEIIWLLPFFIILSKWILIFYIYRDFSYDFSILLKIKLVGSHQMKLVKSQDTSINLTLFTPTLILMTIIKMKLIF